MNHQIPGVPRWLIRWCRLLAGDFIFSLPGPLGKLIECLQNSWFKRVTWTPPMLNQMSPCQILLVTNKSLSLGIVKGLGTLLVSFLVAWTKFLTGSLKEGKVCCVSQFRSIPVMAAATWDGWSQCVHTQSTESNDCLSSAGSVLFI